MRPNRDNENFLLPDGRLRNGKVCGCPFRQSTVARRRLARDQAGLSPPVDELRAESSVSRQRQRSSGRQGLSRAGQRRTTSGWLPPDSKAAGTGRWVAMGGRLTGSARSAAICRLYLLLAAVGVAAIGCRSTVEYDPGAAGNPSYRQKEHYGFDG